MFKKGMSLGSAIQRIEQLRFRSKNPDKVRKQLATGNVLKTKLSRQYVKATALWKTLFQTSAPAYFLLNPDKK